MGGVIVLIVVSSNVTHTAKTTGFHVRCTFFQGYMIYSAVFEDKEKNMKQGKKTKKAKKNQVPDLESVESSHGQPDFYQEVV